MIEVINASFRTSAKNLSKCPHEGVSEAVFIGRSNVGKSSLLNALTKNKNLAKKSSTPGKTRLINYFEIFYNTKDKKQVYFVDLPGYGYAKVSKSEQNLWEKDLKNFIENRISIRTFLLLIDSRHSKLQIDEDVFSYLKSVKKGDQEILKVFTKIDKLKQNEFTKLKKEYQNSLFVSSVKKQGLDILNQKIFTSLLGDNALEEVY